MPKEIPDKLFFKIGEVAKITEVEPHVLRYWESEFGLLMPEKSKTGQRVYRKKDIEMVLEIKRLLYEERFSIEGAKKRLFKRHKVSDNREAVLEKIEGFKKDLSDILSMLNTPIQKSKNLQGQS